jgi:two-component system sensor histidine kinase UhpB
LRGDWSLKWRLLALFAAFATVEMVATMAIQLVHAEEFIEEEMKAAVQQEIPLAQHIMTHDVAGAADYAAALGPARVELAETPIRHVTIEILDRAGRTVLKSTPDTSEPWTAPDWYAALFRIPMVEWRRQGPLGTYVITGDPSVEISEAWENTVTVAALIVTLNVGLMLLVYLLIGRLMRPLRSFERDLARLERGEFDVTPEPGQLPEFSRMSARLTSLRDSLRRLDGENRKLAKGLITVQDAERHQLAHEIHDGLGPYIFSIRVDAQGLMSAAEAGPVTAEDAATRGAAILAAADSIKEMTRGILKRLRPMALDHMRLQELLGDMVETWRRQHPDMEWQLALGDDLDGMDETSNVTLYHMVKEAGLNVIRHAQARRVWIQVRRQPMSGSGRLDMVQVQVSDDGSGMGPEQRDGVGLAGMRERVRALSGILSVGPRPGGGTTLLAGIPVAARQTGRISSDG